MRCTLVSFCWRLICSLFAVDASVTKALIVAGLLVTWVAPSAKALGIFWANFGSNTIGGANLDGTGVNQSFITAVVPQASRSTGPTSTGRMERTRSAARTSTARGSNQSFITGADLPDGVAVDGTHIYWDELPTVTIGRANLDGTGVNQSFITGADTPARHRGRRDPHLLGE